MRKYISFLFLLVIMFKTNLFAATIPSNSNHDVHIVKIESLNQIAESTQAIYLIDLDDTLFDFPYMLGSKAWRKYITSATKEDLTENWHDLFSLFIARNHPLETVEAVTKQFILNLQATGNVVFGLTARERERWYDTPVDGIDRMTISQLKSVGINFNDECLVNAYSWLTNSPEFYEGVFFADLDSKGDYLLKLFKDAPELPKKVIFIDDKLSQVESVAAALSQLGIDHECYWYVATDKKASKFDPLIANIQLYYFWISGGERIISDEEAATIAEQHPERNAEYYLQSLLKEAKHQLSKNPT